MRSPNDGLIVTASVLARLHRELIIKQAASHRLPTVYSDQIFVSDGGLISYGPDRVEQYRQAAGYVDRILKGEKPADLPVQAPTKYELVYVPPSGRVHRSNPQRREPCRFARRPID